MTFIANPYVRETPLAFGAGSLALRASANRGRWALITDGEVVVTE